jgi:hypothetical protein
MSKEIIQGQDKEMQRKKKKSKNERETAPVVTDEALQQSTLQTVFRLV